jgi:uncharacterized SAM-binding protein YcdF (DUF218 family)
MNLLKSIIFVLSDPVVQIFILFLVVFIFNYLCKFWKLLFFYFVLTSSSIFYFIIATLWSVSDTIDHSKKYDVALLLLGVSDYQWHGKYKLNENSQYCNLNKNGGRIGYIIQQIQSNKIENILVGRLIINDFNETACVVNLLRQHGVLENRIKVLGNVHRTSDEISELRKYLANYEHLSVLMVTSSYHMRRAVSISNSQKINLDYYSIDKVTYDTIFNDFIISSKWLNKIKHLLYEVFAYIGYLITGKV